MNVGIELLKKYKGVIAYIFFGVCTTLINMIIYHFCYYNFRVSNIFSNIIAWIFAVSFAFITNKLFVFDSKSFDREILISEACKFFGCRIATGILDVAIMYITVDIIGGNALFWKFVSNIFIIIVNYIASKMIIFRKNKKLYHKKYIEFNMDK